MEISKRFGFKLPSSNDDDIADINQISDNFRLIEEKAVMSTELGNSPSTKYASAITDKISGTAVVLTDISPIEHTLRVKARSENVDVSTASVERYGKNFQSVASVTTAENRSGVFVLPVKNHGTYTLSCDITKYADDTATNTRSTIAVKYTDGTAKEAHSVFDANSAESDGVARKKTATITTAPDKNIEQIAIYCMNYSAANSRNARADNIQVELSPIATEFEPFKQPTIHSINADGTVEGVTALSPTTTLIPDTEGVVLDVEYNVDTKKYIDKKFAELAAMIVNS